MDFIEHLPPSSGFTSILVIMDRLSKQCIFIPMHDMIDSPSVGGILVPCVNRLYGPVLTLWTYHAHYDMESCNQGAFLIGFLEVLQSLPSTSRKIQLIRAILTIILPCQ
jgi:hypothetical protein